MFIILMGVSGSGKTTIGHMLTDRLGWPFYDGDDFHPPANVAKMAAGIPLNDEDRAGWLEALASLIRKALERGENGVLACSALKHVYRDELRRVDQDRVRFVFLKGSYELILARMGSRGKHFMRPEMLKSQFAILEEPQAVLTMDIALPEAEIVRGIVEVVEGGKWPVEGEG